MGAVWDVILPENVLRCVEIWHNQGVEISEFEEAAMEVTFAPGVRLAGKVWQTGEPDWIVNFADEEFSLNALVAAKYGMNSAFGIPIKVGGEVMHVLEFFSPKASEPDPELLQMLAVIGTQIGYLVERKMAEEALRDTVTRKGAILESSLDSIITFDNEGKVIEWNTAAERTFGYRRQDAIGRSISELIIPESERTAPGGGLPLYTASGAAFGRSTEISAIRANGQEFPVEVAISKVSVQRHPIYTIYVRDISDSKRAIRLRNELAAVVGNSEDAIISQTLDGIITSWSPGAQDVYGYSEKEVLGRPVTMLVPADQYDEYVQGQEQVRQGQRVQFVEAERLHKDGRRIFACVTEAPIRNERGVITGIVSTARDVTENKRIENQLLQSQKMEAVGRLAGGVAHDFNNILTAILGYSDLILNQMEQGTPMYKNVSEIRKAGQFAASLTHQLLAFSRGQALELKVLDLNDVIGSIQPMLRRLIGEEVNIVVVPASKIGLVRADQGQLEQVILNLAVNARDAMPSGGVITIHTSCVEIGPDTLDTREIAPGKWVKLTVRDTGVGMSEEVKKHIFEPFFTTKERGRGTGLGLATCYGIVKQTGGHILCESSPGLGTTFHIYLPQVEAGGAETLPVEREFEGLDFPKGTETILLVEDEKSVRKLTAHVLKRLGYTVLEAESAEEAQQIVMSQPDQNIDLLLSDVVLPNCGGKQLADWIRQNSPDIRVLFTSGYVEEVVFNNYDLDKEVPFLQKPFTPVALARKVREVIEA
jgi:PAS domain S-box-containing protein